MPGTTPPTARRMASRSNCVRRILGSPANCKSCHSPRKRGIQYASAYRLNHCRLWDAGSPAFAGDDDKSAELVSRSHIVPPSLRSQLAGRALAAAMAPVMPRAALAEIASVGVVADQVEQPCPSEVVRELPGRGLVEPHQWRVQLEIPGHAEIERGIHRL